MHITEPPPYDAFLCKLCSCNPLEAKYTDYVNLLKSRLTTEKAVVKLKLTKPLSSRIEKNQYLQQLRKQEQMSSFEDFSRCYSNRDVPTLEAMQKLFTFHHDKDIDMLKLGCTLPNLVSICLHKSTDSKFDPFTEGDKDFLEKIQEVVVDGPPIVFTRKAIVDETFTLKSTIICKSFVGINAKQLCPYSMCELNATGFIRVGISIEKRLDSHLDKSKPAALKIGYILFPTNKIRRWK